MNANEAIDVIQSRMNALVEIPDEHGGSIAANSQLFGMIFVLERLGYKVDPDSRGVNYKITKRD